MIRAKGWWDDRIVGGFMSYWCFQHLGNLSPEDRAEDEIYDQVLAAEGDAGPIVREFAFRADREVDGTRWSYKRDIGRTRLIMMDSRGGRVLTPGQRSMVDEDEWDCIVEWTKGDFDHLLMGTSLPVFLANGTHFLEAWNEAICDGAWGKTASRVGEKIRQGLDLEHWAAFRDSSAAPRGPAGGGRLRPPRRGHGAGDDGADERRRPSRLPVASALQLRRRPGARLPGGLLAVPQPADSREQRAMKAAMSRIRRARRALPGPRGARRPRPGHLGDRRRAVVRQPGRAPRPGAGKSVFRIEKALGAGDEDPHLEEVCVRRLA